METYLDNKTAQIFAVTCIILQIKLKINKSSFMAGLCESKQNCQRHPMSMHIFYYKFIARKCLILKMKVISAGAQHQQWCHLMVNIKIYKNIAHFFAIAFTISKILAFKMFDLEILGQGRLVQHSQCCHSMALFKSSLNVNHCLRNLYPDKRHHVHSMTSRPCGHNFTLPKFRL